MKWNVRTKIASVFLLAVAILVGFGLIARTTTTELLDAMEVRRQTYEVRLTLERLTSSLGEAESEARAFLLSGSEPHLLPHATAVKLAQDHLRRLRQMTAADPVQQGRVDTLERLVPARLAVMEETIALRRGQGIEAAVELTKSGKGARIMDEIRDLLAQIRTTEDDLFSRRSSTAIERADRARIVVSYGSLLAVGILALCGAIIARNIARPLEAITLTARRIGRGELSARIDASPRSDEVGVLIQTFTSMTQSLQGFSAAAQAAATGDLTHHVRPLSDRDEFGTAFSTMLTGLREVMRQLLETMNVLSSSSSQITASTRQVSASIAETAAAVTETTATVEEVKHTAQLSRDKGREMASSAQQAAEVALRGRESVEGTVAGMKRIRDQMDDIGSSMLQLSEQTQAISEIIATVNDLAEQSNVLAVNAAIEAAKAGEHGKSFGVVAQEVRTLAEQSKQATAQVRAILAEIQKAATTAMLVTEQGSKAVDAGVEQAADSGSSIAALAVSISASAQAASQIAASSHQQSVGMDQVAIAIRNIQEATTQNSEAVRSVETAASDIADVGERLRALLERYKV